ncbi:MAG: hypothetical protein C4318_08615 [Acidimicrobiia bacterium]
MGDRQGSGGRSPKPDRGYLDGKLFKKWREEAGISLREFCRRFKQKTGITIADSNLSAMEQGRRRLPDEVITYGAEILGRDPLDFPEYRLRQIPVDVLTDPFADRLLRMLVRMRELDELQRAELRGSAKLLELMEEEVSYSGMSERGGAASTTGEKEPQGFSRDSSPRPVGETDKSATIEARHKKEVAPKTRRNSKR